MHVRTLILCLPFLTTLINFAAYLFRLLIQPFGAPMRKLRGFASLFIPVLCLGLMWPQAQPKPAPPPTLQATAPATTPSACAADYYRNINGVCVHRPIRSSSVPQGASAQCRDGSYSFSRHRKGTCSHHGGVTKWLLGTVTSEVS
jgi:hypothetical protein